VRLYLSSFRMGDHPEHLVALISGDGRRNVVIANAMDDAPPDARRASLEVELAALAGLGLAATELDLRDYFGQQQRLRQDLAGVALAWLRGGNTFMLRYALCRSGADTVFRDLLAADALVYAGYSAGACVLSPGLRGLELLVNGPETTIV
jgi:dipeptidase E